MILNKSLSYDPYLPTNPTQQQTVGLGKLGRGI